MKEMSEVEIIALNIAITGVGSKTFAAAKEEFEDLLGFTVEPVTPVDAQPTGLTEEDWDCIVDSLECDWGNENGTIPKPIHDLIEKIDKLRTQAGVGLTEEEIWFMEKAMQKFVSWGSTSRQWAEIAPIVAKLKASLRTQAGVVLTKEEANHIAFNKKGNFEGTCDICVGIFNKCAEYSNFPQIKVDDDSDDEAQLKAGSNE